MRITTTFDRIKLKAKKIGKCPCGKRLTRQKTFSQTLNPYNKKGGRLKTRDEIYRELEVEANEWTAELVHCATPQYWSWTDKQRKQYNDKGSVTLEAVCGTKIIQRRPA